MSRVALVTGGNRGLGLETCRGLARQGLHVYLGSRAPERGRAAVEALQREGLTTLTALQLEVTSPDDLANAREAILGAHGRLEVLVNNAAIYPDEGVSVFNVPEETVRQTMEVNFYGPLALCRAFLPGMIAGGYGRVVNVSSTSGQLEKMGGRTAAYRISKAALNALTRILAAEARAPDVKVNAVCPGWVRTEMGGPAAPRDTVEGADTILWLATLPADGPTGGFFRDRKPIPW